KPRLNRLPRHAAVYRAQDCPALADGTAFALVAKVNVIERRFRLRELLRPSLAAVIRVQDCSANADDPPALFVREGDVYQLLFGRNFLSLPGLSAVVGIDDETINDHIFTADRADDPAALFAGEADAVQFRRCAAEVGGEVAAYLLPILSAVVRLKDA